ncbi:hypothetical protein AVEN_55496-1 [Araneus ventricosus]|uniref:Uncharacterized protein n=1 Tax=Araneus ventricosus TaxID=182803 RepID=A0A4Y2C9I0_ARAVE|nr:hypothetical protein AVEN_55496-1 [Araneus ventricosus]
MRYFAPKEWKQTIYRVPTYIRCRGGRGGGLLNGDSLGHKVGVKDIMDSDKTLEQRLVNVANAPCDPGKSGRVADDLGYITVRETKESRE